jgi:hypothetical protein
VGINAFRVTRTVNKGVDTQDSEFGTQVVSPQRQDFVKNKRTFYEDFATMQKNVTVDILQLPQALKCNGFSRQMLTFSKLA